MYPNHSVLKIFLFSFCILLLFFFNSCSTSRSIRGSKQEYDYYSKLYDVRLSGNEDLRLLKVAEPWLGVKYKLGGTTKAGIDCSALVCEIYRTAYNVNLPRQSKNIRPAVKSISKNSIKFGDLLFFSIKSRDISHLGIYLGENKFLHASTSQGVSVALLNKKYWQTYWVSSGRVLELTTKKTKIKKSQRPPQPTPTPTDDIDNERLEYIVPEL